MATKLGKHLGSSLIICTFLAFVLVSLNCGSDNPAGTTGSGYAEVYAVVGAGAWEEVETLLKDGGPVALEDMASFLLKVDRIILVAEDDSVEGEEGFTEAEDDSSKKVVIFDASEQPAVDNEIDLVDLSNLSDIISSAEVPPDDYSKVELEISDPRLNLVGDAVGEYRTNIQLTANGRMFSSVHLAISEGETVNLNLLVDRIHLVEKGNGDFVLTPQLRVEILPEVELQGEL